MINIHIAERCECKAIAHLIEERTNKPCDVNRLELLLFDNNYSKAVIGYSNERPFALCLYQHVLSVLADKKGIFIEDIYVSPEFRGDGIGKFVLQSVAQNAEREGLDFIEWCCDANNEKAIRFCKNVGAVTVNGEYQFRVETENIHEFGMFKCSCCAGECSGECENCDSI